MRRTSTVVLSAILAFFLVAGVILRFMPQPAAGSDYLIAGSVATLVALLAMFLGFVLGRGKPQDIFFKKRPKQPTKP